MNLSKWRNRIFGTRVMKTALAVFLTSIICEWLDWPPVFAVITAIVTIEPTISASIKKGLVRFPASAIGSLYAVLFIYFFGNSPITYALAAFFTIITCFRLRLHDGLLVATLTSVAMIEVIHSNLFFSFLIRLGTTTIGISVSTLVNMFISPPDYTKQIMKNINDLLKQTSKQIDATMKHLVNENGVVRKKKDIVLPFKSLKKLLDQTDKLLQFQESESKYHRLNEQSKNVFQYQQKNLSRLRVIHYHIGNLVNTPMEYVCWSSEESEEIIEMVEILVDFMQHPDQFKATIYRRHVKKLMNQFWTSKKPNDEEHPSLFTPEVIILYELLSIYNIVEKILQDDKEFSKKFNK